MDKKINSYSLKFTGKVELPKPLEQEHEYVFAIRGDIRGYSDKPTDDGEFDATYSAQLVSVEVIDPLGESVKSKDKRSESKKTRFAIVAELDDLGADIDPEEGYSEFQQWLRGKKLRGLVEEFLEDRRERVE